MKNIFVPSKNRVNNSKLIQLAVEQNIPINVVLEPQDEAMYRDKFPDLNYLILPKNSGGITYVRNWIKQYTEDNGFETYWQLDDDITSFYHREGTKMIKDTFEVLLLASIGFLENGIALGGLEYQQLAWSSTKEYVNNSFCDSCVYVDNVMTKGMRYREYVEGKEDRDFAMQVIKAGQKTARTTLFAFAAPANGSNAGGLKEIFYDLGKEETCVGRMVELWGNEICVPIVKDSGRKDVKIYWKKINSPQTSLF